MATTEDRIEAADTLDECVEILGGEEATVLFIKRQVRAKETSRLAHKKNYLRRQMIVKKAIEAGLDKEI